MPVVVSFSKTSIKAGKQLISIARFVGGDLFAHKYALKTRQVTGPLGTYLVLDVAKTGVPSDSEFSTRETWWDEFRTKDIKVHEESEDIETDRPF